jgi:hypothetical protein
MVNALHRSDGLVFLFVRLMLAARLLFLDVACLWLGMLLTALSTKPF